MPIPGLSLLDPFASRLSAAATLSEQSDPFAMRDCIRVGRQERISTGPPFREQ